MKRIAAFLLLFALSIAVSTTGQCSTGEQKYRRKWTRGPQSGEAAAKVQQKGGEKTAQSDEEIPESAEEGEQADRNAVTDSFRFLAINSLLKQRKPHI